MGCKGSVERIMLVIADEMNFGPYHAQEAETVLECLSSGTERDYHSLCKISILHWNICMRNRY